MRLEEAIRRKRARPDDEGGRPDVAVGVAARNPSSSWEVRPEPSRRGDAEENLAETWSEQGCRILRALCAYSREGVAAAA